MKIKYKLEAFYYVFEVEVLNAVYIKWIKLQIRYF